MAQIRSETPESVLSFWFGSSQLASEISKQQKSLWWSKNDKIDTEIIQRFQGLVDGVKKDKYSHWGETPPGLLATIICLDQFPRNMYRGKAQSFSYDRFALEYAKLFVSKNFDKELPLIYRVFGYIPFEHSENIEDQERSVELYLNLVNEVREEDKNLFEGFYQFALKHYEFIQEFGRFPHRNSILGRESTKQELEFLAQPGSSF